MLSILLMIAPNYPDIISDVSNPESLHRFSYVRNDALNRIDPERKRDIDCHYCPADLQRLVKNPSSVDAVVTSDRSGGL